MLSALLDGSFKLGAGVPTLNAVTFAKIFLQTFFTVIIPLNYQFLLWYRN